MKESGGFVLVCDPVNDLDIYRQSEKKKNRRGRRWGVKSPGKQNPDGGVGRA